MQLGIGVPAKSTDKYCIPAHRLVSYVQRAEEYGFGGAWCLEHLTVPSSYKTSFQDPLTTLSTLAGATERITLGTSIIILPMRHPVLVAKRAASLQYFSGNRLTLGMGQGYIEEEFDAVGIPFEERHGRFSEGLELVYRLLREENVTFDGKYYQTDDLTIEPRLKQPPTILAAGGGRERDGEWQVAESVNKRVNSVGGWISSSGAKIKKDWDVISASLEAQGREPREIERVGLQHIHLVPGDDTDVIREKQHKMFDKFLGDDRETGYADDNFLVGTVDEIKAHLREYEETGFDQVILHPAAYTANGIDRQLELWRKHLLPEFA